MNTQKHITALVTGATGAIGEAIAHGLAKQPNYHVQLVARDKAKAERTVARVRQTTGNQDVDYLLADLGRQAEIYALAEN